MPVLGEAVRPLAQDLVLREHPAGIDLVHPHAVLPEQHVPEVPRHRHERAFRHRVGQQDRLTAVGVDAPDVEHAPVRRPQVRQRRLDEPQRRERVDGEHSLEQRHIGGVDVAGAHAGGVVDHPVEPAEGADSQPDQSLGTACHGEILDVADGSRTARRSGLAQVRHDLRHEVGLEAVDDDAGALRHAPRRDRPADAGGAAGHDHHLVTQTHVACLPGSCRSHPRPRGLNAPGHAGHGSHGR